MPVPRLCLSLIHSDSLLQCLLFNQLARSRSSLCLCVFSLPRLPKNSIDWKEEEDGEEEKEEKKSKYS